MNKIHASFMIAPIAAISVFLITSCVFSSGKQSGVDTASSSRNRLTVAWRFTPESIDDEPHTAAWLVITGKSVQEEPAGRFYGGVMKSYTAADGSDDAMKKGNLGGFMTYYSGTGAEVVARYDGTSHSITLLRRDVGEDTGKAPYRAIKTFTIREHGIIDSPPSED